MKTVIITFLLGMTLSLTPLHAQTKTLSINPVINDNYAYCIELLKLALANSGSDYRFETVDASGSQSREIQDLLDGRIDVIWIGTSTEIEAQLKPIRVPLYRGLLGHRIFIIREGDQARFDRVQTLADLQKISIGQGRTWVDTNILEANGFTVEKSSKYPGLFHMLDGGRFDAFSRGVHEPWGELSTNSELPLTVEKRLAVIYRLPMYFFVSPKSTELAEDIERGLYTMIENGEFDRFFYNNKMIRDTLEQANLQQRLLFHLDNPYLPASTPVDQPELWFDVSAL